MEDYYMLLDEDRSFRAGIPTIMVVASFDQYLPSPVIIFRYNFE